MCLSRPKIPKAAPMMIPSTQNAEAQREADLEAALRRRRAGAAADVLTSPVGVPSGRSSAQLGKVA
jgi:hypothetical protein